MVGRDHPQVGRRATTPGCCCSPVRTQLADRDLRAGVGPQDPRVAGEAARLTKVGEHGALVGADLEAAGELGEGDDGDSSSRARILRPRLISDTSTWRFSALDRPVMSWR